MNTPPYNQSAVSESLGIIAKQVRSLKKMGFQSPHPWTDKDYFLEILEPESIGIHDGYCDEHGYWITDGDCWPSDPILIRRLEKRDEAIHIHQPEEDTQCPPSAS